VPNKFYTLQPRVVGTAGIKNMEALLNGALPYFLRKSFGLSGQILLSPLSYCQDTTFAGTVVFYTLPVKNHLLLKQPRA
jgi:hypothetical protein